MRSPAQHGWQEGPRSNIKEWTPPSSQHAQGQEEGGQNSRKSHGSKTEKIFLDKPFPHMLMRRALICLLFHKIPPLPLSLLANIFPQQLQTLFCLSEAPNLSFLNMKNCSCEPHWLLPGKEQNMGARAQFTARQDLKLGKVQTTAANTFSFLAVVLLQGEWP